MPKQNLLSLKCLILNNFRGSIQSIPKNSYMTIHSVLNSKKKDWQGLQAKNIPTQKSWISLNISD